MALEGFTTYDTIESLERLVEAKNGDGIYAQIVADAKVHIKLLPESQKPEYIHRILIILQGLEEAENKNAKLSGLIVDQARNKVDDLALQMRLGIDTDAVFQIRNKVYKHFGSMGLIMTPPGLMGSVFYFRRTGMPFNLEKINLINVDPMKNGKIVQVIMGLVDEFIFSFADLIGIGINSVSFDELLGTISAVIKEMFTINFLKTIASMTGSGVSSLFTDWDNSQGDLIYRKTREVCMAMGIGLLVKGVAKKFIRIGRTAYGLSKKAIEQSKRDGKENPPSN